ncbi:hypothetical protein BW731_07210 [Vagococcus martis]|uniref:N-acetyltransferase domain-containing protein n=1 Tax=Vagococcus martis TaxID=1768210 RepID=A0A1V4DHN9_9ENTE|nr:GNAT family N-acetyltransferase [Vagococcus martis]OPF87973.1 hypothetical protein BW731_07210 [Vagococcus martis]
MITFENKSFESLTNQEIFEMYQLRVSVFVVEQKCPYQEVDDTDLIATHILGKNEVGELIAYMRIYETSDTCWYIGRVIVKKEERQANYGRLLVEFGLSQISSGYLIKAQAQERLQRFYTSFGFQPVSEVYLEDNIPHIDMEFKKV